MGYALYTTHERPVFFNQPISTGKNFFRFEAKNGVPQCPSSASEGIMDAPISRQIGSLEVLYDQEADVLYLSVGSPKPSSIIEDQEVLLIQRDLTTGEVVGATVLDYQQRFRGLPDLSWILGLRLPQDLTNFLLRRPAA